MDVAWQDSGGGSFFDSSGTDPTSFASFASDDGSALWSSSSDSPVFSGQSVLWESGADAPADSHIGALTADRWIADAGGSVALDGGLLWGGTASDTSSTLTSNGGIGLGALDLGASSDGSLWRQFVDQFAGGSATGLADAPQLLWTGAGSQVTVPVVGGLLQIAPPDSLSAAAVGNLAPTQLLWTQPSGTTGLTSGPSLIDAAPTTPISGAGIMGSSSRNLPLAGAGSHG